MGRLNLRLQRPQRSKNHKPQTPGYKQRALSVATHHEPRAAPASPFGGDGGAAASRGLFGRMRITSARGGRVTKYDPTFRPRNANYPHPNPPPGEGEKEGRIMPKQLGCGRSRPPPYGRGRRARGLVDRGGKANLAWRFEAKGAVLALCEGGRRGVPRTGCAVGDVQANCSPTLLSPGALPGWPRGEEPTAQRPTSRDRARCGSPRFLALYEPREAGPVVLGCRAQSRRKAGRDPGGGRVRAASAALSLRAAPPER